MSAPEVTSVKEQEQAVNAGLLPQLRMMLRALLSSSVGKIIVWLAVAIFVVIAATAYAQILLNRWNKPFYDALSRRDFYGFLYQLGVFCLIAGGLTILNVGQRWLQEMLKVRLREGLVRDLLHDWMRPGRALMLAQAGPMGVNPDQRMHEDTRRLCELSADLGSGLLQSSILLITFIGVLWNLSSGFAIRIGAHDRPIPGYMVWAAIAYAGLGSMVSYWVGRSLIPRNAERYAQEADLRFSLVRVNEHLDGITLAGGEAGETRRVEMHLDSVLTAMRRLVTGLTNLTWVTAGFGWLTLVAPIIVAAPLYFQGSLSFGGLMMAAAAFSQAQSSLRWFVDNFSSIADWRAILLRVASFRHALTQAESLSPDEGRISNLDGEPGEIRLEELEVVSPSGRDALNERSVRLRPGEHLLIVAEPGTGKTQLFRALAGLWPWGSGRILKPPGEAIFYLPRGTPYFPRGTLREVLAYPGHAEGFDEPCYPLALRRFGLERLVPMLDQTHRWDRELSQEEQVGLAFARIVLQQPPWLIVDDTIGSLDGDTLERLVDAFARELDHTGVIHISTAAVREPLFTRVIHLVRTRTPRRARGGIAPLLALVAVLLAPLFAPAHAAAAQEFQFRPPSSLDEAATTQLMRDLAVRVLPVYSDSDRIRYLTNLSALQLIAEDYAAANATRLILRDRLKDITTPLPIEQSVAFDIYAHTEALSAQSHTPFGTAFKQSFTEVVPHLDDRSDYAVTSWFQTPVSLFRAALQRELGRERSPRTISLPEALQLVWTYLAYQAHLSIGPQADLLIAADSEQRYITAPILITEAHGVRLSAMLVRPRSATQRLPALLEFTIDPSPDNDAKECAAYGYVGVVAYTRGKVIAGRGAIEPYEHDGDDAQNVIDWVVKQPWSDGRVGMYGAGYSGFTAWAAAKHPAPALKAIATASAIAPGIDLPMRDTIFLNSAYRWSRFVASDSGLDETEYEQLAHWQELDANWYRSGKAYEALPRIEGKPNPIFQRWLTHPTYDAYWQRMIPDPQEFAHLQIPALTISGYYDAHETGALYYFEQREHYQPNADQTLLLGPYDETPPSGTLGTPRQRATLDPAAQIDLHELRYEWFDHVLKGAPVPALLQGRINYEVAGANVWRHVASLSAMSNRTLRWQLDPSRSDLPSTPTVMYHRLSEQATPADFLDQSIDFADRSDAEWEAPTQLQSAEVPTHYSLVYVSAALRQPIELDGAISGALDVDLSKRDVDFSIALYERLPEGSFLKLYDSPDEWRASYLKSLSQQHLLRPLVAQRLTFQSEHIVSHWLSPGSRVVLVLSISKRPDQELNYGTGGVVSHESIADAKRPLNIRWYASSYIDLPLAVSAAAPAAHPAPTPPTKH